MVVHPYKNGNWIVFPLNKSIVLASLEVRMIWLPYQLHGRVNVLQDGLVRKEVAVFSQIFAEWTDDLCNQELVC